jgi:translation initiation factor 3 subunit D
VYGTDAILSVLMSATRSVYSWDLVVRKSGDTLVWDKRAKSNIDALTVHETGNEVGLELDDDASINHPAQLSAETTAVNHHFTQQVLVKDGEKWTPEEAKGESPFLAGVEAGSCAPTFI